jgi:hypothetical protein
VDSQGNLFVAEQYSIRKVSPAGEVTRIGGSSGCAGSLDGVGRAARFGAALRLVVDDAGNLYIADSMNHKIRKGTPRLVSGPAKKPAPASGGPTSQAQEARAENPEPGTRPAAPESDGGSNSELASNSVSPTTNQITWGEVKDGFQMGAVLEPSAAVIHCFIRNATSNSVAYQAEYLGYVGKVRLEVKQEGLWVSLRGFLRYPMVAVNGGSPSVMAGPGTILAKALYDLPAKLRYGPPIPFTNDLGRRYSTPFRSGFPSPGLLGATFHCDLLAFPWPAGLLREGAVEVCVEQQMVLRRDPLPGQETAGRFESTPLLSPSLTVDGTQIAALFKKLEQAAVVLTAPTNGTTVFAPTNVLLSARADGPEGDASKVEFFAYDLKLGERTNSPFSLIWSNAPVGFYRLKAVATDRGGPARTSAQVNLVVADAPIATGRLKAALEQLDRLDKALEGLEVVPTQSPTNAWPTRPDDPQRRSDSAGGGNSQPGTRNSELNQTTPKQQAILDRLRRIKLDNLFFDSVPLDEVVKSLADEAQKRDPDPRKPINFLIRGTVESPSAYTGPLVDPATGLAVLPAEVPDLSTIRVRVTPTLKRVTLEEALEIITKCAAQPIQYVVENEAIVFTPKPPPSLSFRTFKPGTNIFQRWVSWGQTNAVGNVGTNRPSRGTGASGGSYGGGGDGGGAQGQHIQARLMTNALGTNLPSGRSMPRVEQPGVFLSEPTPTEGIHADAREFFALLGVNLGAPSAAFWNDRLGLLLVKATKEDLDTIESALEALKQALGSMDTNSREPRTVNDQRPNGENGRGLTSAATAILNRLRRIKLDTVAFDNLPLSEVIKGLLIQAETRNPDPEQPVNFLLCNPADEALAPADSRAVPGGARRDIATISVRVTPALRNVTLEAVLEAIVKNSALPIQYSVEDYAIVFTPGTKPGPPLRFQAFRMDTNPFPKFLGTLGLDLAAPKAAIWNDRLGLLLVRATQEELDAIAKAIQSHAALIKDSELEARPAAAEFTGTTNNGTLTINRYLGPGGAVTIPGTLHGLPVTSLGRMAFFMRESLTNISIPDSVPRLWTNAFIRQTEPAYQGRTLSEWVKRLGRSGMLDLTDAEAVRQIGAQAVPYLLRWLDYDSPDWPEQDEGDNRHRAYASGHALEFVGRDGQKAALPVLAHRLSEAQGWRARQTASALGFLGLEGLPPLVAALTNQETVVRVACVEATCAVFRD